MHTVDRLPPSAVALQEALHMCMYAVRQDNKADAAELGKRSDSIWRKCSPRLLPQLFVEFHLDQVLLEVKSMVAKQVQPWTLGQCAVFDHESCLYVDVTCQLSFCPAHIGTTTPSPNSNSGGTVQFAFCRVIFASFLGKE